MLPEEIKLLAGILARLQDAVTTRRSLRRKRMGCLTPEIADLWKVLSPFAEMPSGYTSTQLEMRRSHLEKTLDAAKDRIDVKDRVCDRKVLALQAELDETLPEYVAAQQLVGMIQRCPVSPSCTQLVDLSVLATPPAKSSVGNTLPSVPSTLPKLTR